MHNDQMQELADLLFDKRMPFKKGLTDKQINDVQEFYNIKFPPDLRELLMCFCPVFCDWSNYSEANIQLLKKRLRWPIKGILFDVENNDFWMECWGIKPDHMKTALEIAEENLATVPPLIPICGHRYIPSNPCEAGNPIYSVKGYDDADFIFADELTLNYGETGYLKKMYLYACTSIAQDIPAALANRAFQSEPFTTHHLKPN